jgi:hypothetical protein
MIIKRFFKEWQYGYFLLLAFLLLLALPTSPLLQSFGCDKEVFRYFGDILANGGTPYIDYFDHKPPIIHFIYSLPFIHDNYWGEWFFFNGLIFTNAILIIVTTRNKGKTAWFFAILWIVYMRFLPIVLDGGNSREITANLIMTFLCIHLYKPKQYYAFKGALVSLVLFTQPNDIVALVPFYLALFFQNGSSRTSIYFIVKSLIGFLIPTIGILLFLIYKGALQAFWQDVVLFNWNAYIFSSSLTYKLRLTLSYCFKFFLPVVILLLVTGSHKKLFSSTSIFLVAILLQLLSNLMGAVFPHYFLPIIPYVIGLLMVHLNADSFAKCKLWIWSVLLYLVAYSNLPKYVAQSGNMASIQPSAFIDSTIKTVANEDYQLFGFHTAAYMHYANQYNIKCPSPYIYHHFWQNKKFDTTLVILNNLIQNIERYKTKYILDCNSEIYFYRPEVGNAYFAYILKNYRPIYRTLYSNQDSLTLFQRKNELY